MNMQNCTFYELQSINYHNSHALLSCESHFLTTCLHLTILTSTQLRAIWGGGQHRSQN